MICQFRNSQSPAEKGRTAKLLVQMCKPRPEIFASPLYKPSTAVPRIQGESLMKNRPVYLKHKGAIIVFYCVVAIIVAMIFPLSVQAANPDSSALSGIDKPDGHIVTALSCEECHLNPANDDFEFVHGSSSLDQCYRCHNDTIASGKPSGHLPTKENCGSCHNNPGGSWSSVRMNHASVTANCISCHNGVLASGKQAGHISAPDS